jgi:hypothetical protein
VTALPDRADYLGLLGRVEQVHAHAEERVLKVWEAMSDVAGLIDRLADRLAVVEERQDVREADGLHPCSCGRPCTGERCSACAEGAA